MSSLSSIGSSSALLNTGPLSVNGLATGLDTDKILDGLLAIQQRRIQTLQAKENRITSQQTAFKGVEARLLSLRNQSVQLGRSQSNLFDVRKVTSSDTDLVTAAASAQATPGIYQVKVGALAQAHQIAGQGYAAPAAAITHGTIQIRAGTAPGATITIDNGNDSLEGLASAINAASIGVTATIVNDGGTVTPYRLLLTSNETGQANAITVTNNLAADSGGAVRPEFGARYIGAAQTSAGFSGASAVSANQGAGAFTGNSNNTYTFNVVNGGLVGTDNGLQVSYSDASGAHTGTITIDAAEADVFQTVAEGIEVRFAAGTLVNGETFQVRGYVPEVQAAADASVTIGAGAGAMTVHSASNDIDDLFGGLALSLNGADPDKTVTLTVSTDVAGAKSAITDFVNGFNSLMAFIDEQTRFDPETNTAGILLGNRQVIDIQEQVRSAVMNPVPGLKPEMNRLGALGISTNEFGRLVVDSAKLDDALSGRIAGVTFDDVRRLFALSGTSSLPGVEFVVGSAKTKASGNPFTVHVTQAAEQAALSATNTLAASTVLTGANNEIVFTVDGLASDTITLTPGTYTRQALVNELQSQITAALTNREVVVGLTGDKITLTSQSYGAASTVSINSGTALGSLGFTGSETDVGTDVAGYFQFGAQQEQATGIGQVLTGLSTNANSAELRLRVSLTPGQVGAEALAEMTITRGVASLFDQAGTAIADPFTGRIKVTNEVFEDSIDDIEREVARQTELMAAQRDRLVLQFAALERTVSELQGIGNYLANQFTQLSLQRQ